MHPSLDQHRGLALERQHRLLADAAPRALADSGPARRRLARSLRRFAGRVDAATPCPGPAGAPLTDCA